MKINNQDLLVWTPEGTKINAHFAWNMHQTYGFPMEMTEEEVNQKFKDNPYLKAWHTTKAYDTAHNTNWLAKLEEKAHELATSEETNTSTQ